MSPPDDPNDLKTLTTISSEGDVPASASTPSLVVVLCGASPELGGLVIPLPGVHQVKVRRGSEPSLCVQPGGGASLQLALPDPKVSSDHGALEVHDDRLVVRDAGSTNGWKIRSVRVREPTALWPHEAAVVGDTLLAFVPAAARPSASPWPFPTTHAGLADDLGRLERLAATPTSLLLHGETGVGKEVVAQAIHQRSGRSGPFVAVNCAALPEGLVEAQLFGHKRGAFSGAVQDAVGFFQAAHQGTLLLDEIGDLPLAAQATLLRVLQQGEVVPVGAVKPQPIQVRVLAATHRPLDQLVRLGQFRADLYARLRGFVITLPPLRERREDLGFIVARIAHQHGLTLKLSGEAAAELYRRQHPFNLREVEQTIVTASYLAQGSRIRPEHLSSTTSLEGEIASTPGPSASASLSEEDQQLASELRRRLAEHKGNISQVARDMGKARQQVQRWLRRFGIEA